MKSKPIERQEVTKSEQESKELYVIGFKAGYAHGWYEALEAVFNLLNKKYFSGEQPVLAILEDKDSRPAMPEIFELLNTLKK